MRAACRPDNEQLKCITLLQCKLGNLINKIEHQSILNGMLWNILLKLKTVICNQESHAICSNIF